MTNFEALLATLARHQTEFIIVGGAAAIAHGSSRLTQDLDIVYRRTPENLARLVAALSKIEPYLRGAPRGLPFSWDTNTLRRGLNFTLTTSLGDIDLLGEIAGRGTYDSLLSGSQVLPMFGFECRCVSLDQLIAAKIAAGRPKDLEVIAELQQIADEQ